MAARMAKRARSRGIPAEGATPSAMPGFIKHQLATLKAQAPNGEQWLNEIKYDGYRVCQRRTRDGVHPQRAGLGGHRLQEPRRAVPLRPQRGMDQGEDREARRLPRRWVYQGPDRGRRALSRQTRRRRAGVQGKVGTGWSRTISSRIRKQLDTAVTAKSPLAKPLRKPKATWVEPCFAAEIEYRDITSEGLLRQAHSRALQRGITYQRDGAHFPSGPRTAPAPPSPESVAGPCPIPGKRRFGKVRICRNQAVQPVFYPDPPGSAGPSSAGSLQCGKNSRKS